jgi:hypothetical protein
MAMNLLGYTRQTVDLDILLTPEGLQRFRERLVGRAYAPAFEGAKKTFRDVETGVRIEVLTSGDYPEDGQPKPVTFPDPALAAVERGGYRVCPDPLPPTLGTGSEGSRREARMKDASRISSVGLEIRIPRFSRLGDSSSLFSPLSR